MLHGRCAPGPRTAPMKSLNDAEDLEWNLCTICDFQLQSESGASVAEPNIFSHTHLLLVIGVQSVHRHYFTS